MAPKKQQKRTYAEVVKENAELKKNMKKMKAEMKDKDSALDWCTQGLNNLKLGLEWRRMGVEDAKRLRHPQVQPLTRTRNHDMPRQMQQITAAEHASALARHAMHAAERAAGTHAARATVAASTASAAAAAAATVAPQPIPADYVPPYQR